MLSWSRAASDLLSSFGCGMGHPRRLFPATTMPSPRRSTCGEINKRGAAFQYSQAISNALERGKGCLLEASLPLSEAERVSIGVPARQSSFPHVLFPICAAQSRRVPML